MEAIRFGTDGWRALIARDFTFDRLARVAEAVARHVTDVTEQGDPTLVVGYDTRFLSEEFALEVARVLATHRIRVLLTDRDAPTPAISHAILHNNTNGACIITASHNPPSYSGIKFQPGNASPAMPEVTDAIEAHLRQLEQEDGVARAPEDSPLIERFDPTEPYLAHLKSLVDVGLIQRSRLHVWVNCLYGTSRGYLDALLRELGCKVDVLNAFRDPLFGGGMPEPGPEQLEDMGARVAQTSAALGVSCDGDADRFGFVDRTGQFVSVNESLACLLWYVTQERFKSGSVVRTIATTRMLDRIAEHRGLRAQEPTPIGFKYLGHAMRTSDAVFAGEESGGVTIRGHIAEKDGIFASLLACELIAATQASFKDMLKTIDGAVGRSYSMRLDLPLTGKTKRKLMKTLLKSTPEAVGKRKVIATDTKTDGACLTLDDDSWLLARPSGTESLVRVYLEAGTQQRLAEFEADARALVEQLTG